MTSTCSRPASPRPSTSCLTRHASRMPEQNAPERTNVPASSVLRREYAIIHRKTEGDRPSWPRNPASGGARARRRRNPGCRLDDQALKARGDSRLRPRTADYIVGTSAGSVLSSLLGAESASTNSSTTSTATRSPKVPWPATRGTTKGHRWNRPHPAPARPGRGKLIRRTLAGGARRCHRPPCSAFLPAGKGSLERVGHLVEAFTPSVSGRRTRTCGSSPSTTKVAAGRIRYENAPTVALSDAVMASCAIPGWFRPMQIDGRTYIDGGAWSATSADLLAGLDLDGCMCWRRCCPSRWTSRTRCSAGSSGGGGSR